MILYVIMAMVFISGRAYEFNNPDTWHQTNDEANETSSNSKGPSKRRLLSAQQRQDWSVVIATAGGVRGMEAGVAVFGILGWPVVVAGYVVGIIAFHGVLYAAEGVQERRRQCIENRQITGPPRPMYRPQEKPCCQCQKYGHWDKKGEELYCTQCSELYDFKYQEGRAAAVIEVNEEQERRILKLSELHKRGLKEGEERMP